MDRITIFRKVIIRMHQHSFTIRFFAFLIFIFFFTLFLLYCFIEYETLSNKSVQIQVEIVKSLLQILVVAIIGGSIGALFRAFDQNQETSRSRIQSKMDFTKQLNKLYRTVKSSRRKLKSKGVTSRNEEDNIILGKDKLEFYITQMDIIDEVQLDLEGLRTEAENFKLFKDCEKISYHMKKMSNYLRKINEEFEQANQSFDTTVGVNFNNLEFLKEFTFPANKPFTFKLKDKNVNRFKSNFLEPFHEILKTLY